MPDLTRYNPFQEMISLREAMDRLFEESFITPRNLLSRGVASNLYETKDDFILQIPMPGVKPEEVEITAQQDTISVKWETKPVAPENATVHWRNFGEGQYQQSFTLPAPINPDRAEAHYQNGILTLRLPKAEQARTRTVKVNTR